MRTIVKWTLTLAVGASTSGLALAQTQALAQVPQQKPQSVQPAPKRAVAPSQAPASAPAAPAAPKDPFAEKALQEAFVRARAEMNALLEEWENQSKKIESLDVNFERIDRSPGFGDQYFVGRAMLKSPDLACLDFTKVKVDSEGKPIMLIGKDGKPTKKVEAQPTERILCTGKEVLQYTFEDKKIFVFPLDKQVRQKALQQGPLPFLFNMKAAEAKERYTMTLAKQSAREYLIEIIPNLPIDQQNFVRAVLWLSKETFLPNKLWLYPIGNKELQEFRFVGEGNTIQPNVPMNDKFFAFTSAPKDWKMIFNPGEPGQDVRAGNAAPAVAKPAPGAVAQPKRQTAQPLPRTNPR